MNRLYRGYVKTKNKKAVEPFKDRSNLRTLEEVENLPEYAGVLAEDVMFIDIDDNDQADLLMDIVDDLQLNCRCIETSRGMHFIFKNSQLKHCKTKTMLACGLTADIKVGCINSYEVLKVEGQDRREIYDINDDEQYHEIPKWLYPITKKSLPFLDMVNGEGRNQELFNYILILQNNHFATEEIRETIRIINKYILKDPLDERELETILRDEAFMKSVFFDGSRFLFDIFAEYIKNTYHIVLIDGNLHIYQDGVYHADLRLIETGMIRIISNLSDAKRKEVIKHLYLICEKKRLADARYIAFKNGIYDMVIGTMQGFTPDIVLNNKIPWDYHPDAFNALTDCTLNKIACQDEAIRSLLEECIGYCFFRQSEIGKAFILIGDKSNGKSTYLSMVRAVLSEDNISVLDLKELGDRFSTSMIFGKLANIGDDIGDDFLQGTQTAIFKKVVTGDRIKAERKGQDPFEFNPYTKLLFSANEIPRMRDKTGAILRRLIIIPFDAQFTKEDPDYDPFIKYKLLEQSSMEYLIKLGIDGLQRVLKNKNFTKSKKVTEQLKEYEQENNPIVAFIDDLEDAQKEILNESTTDVYAKYQIFCNAANVQPVSKISFVKQINKRLSVQSVVKKIKGRCIKVFVKSQSS